MGPTLRLFYGQMKNGLPCMVQIEIAVYGSQRTKIVTVIVFGADNVVGSLLWYEEYFVHKVSELSLNAQKN